MRDTFNNGMSVTVPEIDEFCSFEDLEWPDGELVQRLESDLRVQAVTEMDWNTTGNGTGRGTVTVLLVNGIEEELEFDIRPEHTERRVCPARYCENWQSDCEKHDENGNSVEKSY